MTIHKPSKALKNRQDTIGQTILDNSPAIENWFVQQWQQIPPVITTSVDLRYANYKLAPVDTNLFPAGFNNLHENSLILCEKALKKFLADYFPQTKKILILPENHTRNSYYIESLAVLKNICTNIGCIIRFGSLNLLQQENTEFMTSKGEQILIESLWRENDELRLMNFTPDLILLNNDLSSGLSENLEGLKQPILPSPQLGWWSRKKSDHFTFYNHVIEDFAKLIKIDPWQINPLFNVVSDIDFMEKLGLNDLAVATEEIFTALKNRYASYNITDIPFVVMKADNGTYGMGVMMVHDLAEISHLNRKQRTKMSATKGHQKIKQILVQEGINTIEKTDNGDIAEVVVYLIGQEVVGGFYRAHHKRNSNENLNAPGMYFIPLANEVFQYPNKLYAHSVVARLASLAAAKEVNAITAI